MEASQRETLSYQAEVKQVLHLVIHSLYSNKEIFLRELISNASDATDKLRFAALSDNALYGTDPDLKITITFDAMQRTLKIADNGIGMSRDEVIENLGTIAKSGTREFLARLTGDQKKDAHLIGQFGVGFYSAFIVADRVTVKTRRADLPTGQGVAWESTGEGDYTIEYMDKPTRGTEIILHLKESENEFLDPWRLRAIISKYSDHINLPILMQKMDGVTEKGDPKVSEEFETVNSATALWVLPKSQISEEQYKDLYKHVAHDFTDPLIWSHNRVEGNLEYISLLYIPSQAPMDLWVREKQHGLKLYVQRVFIMDQAEQFLPNYLRFIRGIIDTKSLPLNISREILQDNPTIGKLRNALTKRILDMLEKLAQESGEKYSNFWSQFGNVVKEGPVEDVANRERISKLLRFATTHSDSGIQDVSLEQYISRMKPEQKKIYYLTAENFATAKTSPHLEIFRKNNIEVLLLTDRVDEWLVGHLTEFAGKSFQSVAKGQLNLDEIVGENSEEKKEIQEKETAEQESFSSTLKHVKEVLNERVKEVRLTYRLTSSPSCIVADENDLGIQFQRLLKAAGQEINDVKPIFELNPEHQIVINLKNEQDDEHFKEWVEILFGQAILAEGGQLPDPASFIQRLNGLLLETL